MDSPDAQGRSSARSLRRSARIRALPPVDYTGPEGQEFGAVEIEDNQGRVLSPPGTPAPLDNQGATPPPQEMPQVHLPNVNNRRLPPPRHNRPPINNHWPNIADAIETTFHARQAGVDPEQMGVGGPVTCDIFLEGELSIIGLHPRLDSEDAGKLQQDAVLTVCGHVFGEPCLEAWEMDCVQRGAPFTCPKCRFDLDPERCLVHSLPGWVSLADEMFGFDGTFRLFDSMGTIDIPPRNCADCQSWSFRRRQFVRSLSPNFYV